MNFNRTLYRDLFGRAMWDYVRGEPENLITWTSISPPEILRIDYLFRNYDQMPAHEKIALEMSYGRILDVGAGSGIHSKYLQSIGKTVTALDKSEYACLAMEAQGIRNIVNEDFFGYSPGRKFDTILLLMNGGGIMGTLERAEDFFLRIRHLLNENGQVLIHMSDISYVYYVYNKPLPLDHYYGEVTFYLKYKNMCNESFPWLYFDPHTFGHLAEKYGFETQIVKYDTEGDILVKMFKANKLSNLK